MDEKESISPEIKEILDLIAEMIAASIEEEKSK